MGSKAQLLIQSKELFWKHRIVPKQLCWLVGFLDQIIEEYDYRWEKYGPKSLREENRAEEGHGSVCSWQGSGSECLVERRQYFFFNLPQFVELIFVELLTCNTLWVSGVQHNDPSSRPLLTRWHPVWWGWAHTLLQGQGGTGGVLSATFPCAGETLPQPRLNQALSASCRQGSVTRSTIARRPAFSKMKKEIKRK